MEYMERDSICMGLLEMKLKAEVDLSFPLEKAEWCKWFHSIGN
jgi:hypothetical protein